MLLTKLPLQFSVVVFPESLIKLSDQLPEQGCIDRAGSGKALTDVLLHFKVNLTWSHKDGCKLPTVTCTESFQRSDPKCNIFNGCFIYFF